MAKIIIEIEDLPNGNVSYTTKGDMIIMKNATSAQMTFVAIQKTIEMLNTIMNLQKGEK